MADTPQAQLIPICYNPIWIAGISPRDFLQVSGARQSAGVVTPFVKMKRDWGGDMLPVPESGEIFV